MVSRRYVDISTEIALRHRDVNYKRVTVTLKDVGSMFYCAGTKDVFDPQTYQHKYNRKEVA